MLSDAVWWEAENYSASSDAYLESHEVLSEETWVNLRGVQLGQPRFLEFDELEISNSGIYHFYVRKFWRHGPFSWNFDGDNPEGTVTRNVALIDHAELRLHKVANWTYAGQVFLEAGTHSLRIEVTEQDRAAAFDAFLLTTEPFPFRGKYKPDEDIAEEISEAAEPGWFIWSNPVDKTEPSPIDLSYLNEDIAGEKGFIQALGEDFVHQESSETARFWGVNAGADVLGMDPLNAKAYAKDLARYGVNLVRIQAPIYDTQGQSFGRVNDEKIDQLFYLVSILKAEGIYVSLSIYFPIWASLGPNDPRFPGYNGNTPFGLLFFDSNFQQIYRNWWQQLLTRVSPYTGIALKDEKAIFSLEIINEDSLLFWTFSDRSVPSQPLQGLEKRFANWLISRYGSLAATARSWNGFDRRIDNRADERIGFISLYETGLGKTQRAKDTAQFLTELQRGFFQQHYNFLKRQIGFDGMVSASNWITANETTLGPLDRYSNTVGDFMDRHGYYEPHHQDSGDRSSNFSLRTGHLFKDTSALTLSNALTGEDSFSNPVMNIIYNDKPSVISETNWAMPNRYRADMPFLFASFARLQGLDAVINYTSRVRPWELQLSKFSTYSPVVKGQWSAAALAFREGFIDEGPVVTNTNLPPDYLFELAGTPVAISPNLDNLRNTYGEGQSIPNRHLLKFLTGRTKVTFDPEPDFYEQYDSNELVDTEAKTLTSSTNQLFWNYRDGFATATSPFFQGVTGFLSKAGEQSLADVSISSNMEYGSIWLVSLDGEPIEVSNQMLLLATSEEKTLGWETIETDKGLTEITDLGSGPLLIRNIEGKLVFNRADAEDLIVTALDHGGYRTSNLSRGGSIEFEPTTLYYLIEKTNTPDS